MAPIKQFNRSLDGLFERRTARLRAFVGYKNKGPQPQVTKAVVATRIDYLVATARGILIARLARRAFQESVAGKRQWHVKKNKGWGVSAKKARFKAWYKRNIDGRRCIYIFWAGKRCLYVGQTGRGGSRPSGHFDKYWFPRVTRIDIYATNKSHLTRAECLAIDRFRPRLNKTQPPRKKYAKQCPVCKAERRVRRELKAVFPVPKGRNLA